MGKTMKKTGLYWMSDHYPCEITVYRLGRSDWRFNAQHLESGETATFRFSGDDESAATEYRRVIREYKTAFTNWR